MPRHAPRYGRTWGTRYDALPDSSSVASEEYEKDTSREPTLYTDPQSETRSELSSTGNKPLEEAEASPDDRTDADGLARDTNNRITPSKTSTELPETSSTIEQSFGPRHPLGHRPLPRWNHNASVFVASLPPVPNAELDELLRDTLGKHGSIINIKFIHDVKSGHSANCAFVQFETPEEAAAAIQACHMSFIKGRCIRCEPAKAHRTLLISFRPLPPTDHTKLPQGARIASQDCTNWVRFRRPEPRSRFVQVTYNDEARNFSLIEEQVQWVSEDPLQGSGVLISLNQDAPRASTMKALTEVFGPLESFQSFRVPTSEEARGHPFAPHPPTTPDQPQDENSLTWEVKWEQRNDAVSAVHTLAQLPNLIVTWAHEHPHPSHYYNHPWTPYSGNHQGPPIIIPSPSKINGPTVSPLVSSRRSPHMAIVSLPGSENRRLAPVLDEFPPLPGAVEMNDERKYVPGDAMKGSWKGVGMLAKTGVIAESVRGNEQISRSRGLSRMDWSVYSPGRHTAESNSAELLASGGMPTESPLPNIPPETPISLTHSPLPTPSTVAPVTPSPSASLQQLPSESLFVGGLDRAYGWTDITILDVFSKYGAVESIKLIFKTHAGPGHAFLKYVDRSSMQAAIDGENGSIYGGSVLRVKYSSTNLNRGRGIHWRRTHNIQGLGLEGLADKGGTGPNVSPSVIDGVGNPATAVETAQPVVVVPESHPMSPPHTPASSDIEVAEEVSPTKSNVPLKDAPLLSLEDAQAPLTSRSASPNRSIPQTMHRPTNHLNRRRSRAKSDPATPSVGLKKPLPTESPVSANPKLSPSTVGTSSAATPTMTVPTMSAPFINAEMISLSGHSPQPWKHSSLPPPHASYFPTFVPYMNPSEGSLSSQQGNGGSSPLPPLQPTGFVQNEQGMLIPLYRNEALNQYMAATSHRSPTESNGATYWNHPPPWQPPPPWLPQQAITHHIPSVPTATQLLPGYPLAGYTIDAESMSRSPSQASNRQHHSSTPNSHNMSAVPTASQYPTPKLEPAQPALITSGSQAASLQTPGRGRARNSHHNVKSSRGSYHPHNIGSDARMSGHGPTFQQMAEGKLVSTFSPHGNQGRPPSANTNSAEVIGRPYPPMYGYPQFYDQYITPFPPPTHYPLPQHVQAPSGYPRGPSMQSQWTALPSAYENI